MSKIRQKQQISEQLDRLINALGIKDTKHAFYNQKDDCYLMTANADYRTREKFNILAETLKESGFINKDETLSIEKIVRRMVIESPAMKMEIGLKNHEFTLEVTTRDLSNINIDDFARATDRAIERLDALAQNNRVPSDEHHIINMPSTPPPGAILAARQSLLRHDGKSESNATETLTKKQLNDLLSLLNEYRTLCLGTLSEEKGVFTISYPTSGLEGVRNIYRFAAALNSGIPSDLQTTVFNESLSSSDDKSIVSLIIKPDYDKPVSLYLIRAIKNVENSIAAFDKYTNRMESRAINIKPSDHINEVIDYLKNKIFGESFGSGVIVEYKPASEHSKGEFIVSLDNTRGKNNNFLKTLNSFLPVEAKQLDNMAYDRINFSIEARPEYLAAYFRKQEPEYFANKNKLNQR